MFLYFKGHLNVSVTKISSNYVQCLRVSWRKNYFVLKTWLPLPGGYDLALAEDFLKSRTSDCIQNLTFVKGSDLFY